MLFFNSESFHSGRRLGFYTVPAFVFLLLMRELKRREGRQEEGGGGGSYFYSHPLYGPPSVPMHPVHKHFVEAVVCAIAQLCVCLLCLYERLMVV